MQKIIHHVERRWHACRKTLKTRPHTRGACLCQHSREKLAKLIAIDCVHMTSRRPFWRSKQRNGDHVGGVKYSLGDKTLFLCKTLLLFHYANMASGDMSEHTVHNSTWCKVQNSLFFTIYIINYGLNKNRKEKIKKNRVLHIVEKKGEVSSDHSSKCFRDGHYRMISRERKIFVIS